MPAPCASYRDRYIMPKQNDVDMLRHYALRNG